jgi:glutamate mutase epsilon subunit
MSTAHVRSINHETKLLQESLSSASTITTTNITIRLNLKFTDNICDIGDEQYIQN